MLVGLTGGIGSGKSTALGLFAELGAVTVSADALVHEAYDLPEVRRAVADRLGEGVLGPDGRVDKGKIAAQVFSDDEERGFLEHLLHPFVWRRLAAFVAQTPPGAIVVAEIPLLFEGDGRRRFDVTLALGADPAVRRSRIEGRFSLDDIARRERAQFTDTQRRRLADQFYVNDGSAADLAAWVAKTWADLRRRQESRQASG